MKFYTRDKREVEIESISYGSDPEDTFIEAAYYVDGDDEECSEEVCDQLTQDYAGHLEESWAEHKQCEAEDAYEAAIEARWESEMDR